MNLVEQSKLVFIKVKSKDFSNTSIFKHPELDKLTESGWIIKEYDAEPRIVLQEKEDYDAVIFKIILIKPDQVQGKNKDHLNLEMVENN